MVILTDDQQNPRSRPTRQNIVRHPLPPTCPFILIFARSKQCAGWSVELNQTILYSSIVRHVCVKNSYQMIFLDSGHGGQTKDVDGDEADGYDEVIYPVRSRPRCLLV